MSPWFKQFPVGMRSESAGDCYIPDLYSTCSAIVFVVVPVMLPMVFVFICVVPCSDNDVPERDRTIFGGVAYEVFFEVVDHTKRFNFCFFVPDVFDLDDPNQSCVYLRCGLVSI